MSSGPTQMKLRTLLLMIVIHDIKGGQSFGCSPFFK